MFSKVAQFSQSLSYQQPFSEQPKKLKKIWATFIAQTFQEEPNLVTLNMLYFCARPLKGKNGTFTNFACYTLAGKQEWRSLSLPRRHEQVGWVALLCDVGVSNLFQQNNRRRETYRTGWYGLANSYFIESSFENVFVHGQRYKIVSSKYLFLKNKSR